MTEAKVDPRVVRTRKSIMEAFIELSGRKEFKDITVKDITAEAMINRATFYYHFEDIYDLLEKALSEVLLVNLNAKDYEQAEMTEETVMRIFEAITSFQTALSNRCHRGYEETIGRIIRQQVEVLFYKMLHAEKSDQEETGLKLAATMLSWGIYGASVEWKRDGQVPPEEFIKPAIPYLLQGIGSGK